VSSGEDGRIRRARERRAATRRDLVDSARELFARDGYAATTPAAIARAVGVSRSTFYQHFDGKADAFAAVVDDLLVKLDAVVVGVDLSDGAVTPEVQIFGNLMRVLDVLLSKPEYAQLLLVESVGMEDVLQGRVEGFFRDMLTLIRDGLSEGQEAGLVRPAQIDIAAWAVLGAINEVLRRSLTSGRDNFDVGERQRIAYELLVCCLAGVGSLPVRDAILALDPSR